MKEETQKCTECNGDATVGYTASKDSDWNGLVKKGELLCTKCFKRRTGFSIF